MPLILRDTDGVMRTIRTRPALSATDTNGILRAESTVYAAIPGATSFLVAAVDASINVRSRADYVCSGVSDEVQINGAIGALPATGGRVVLSEGTFEIAAPIADQGKSAVSLVGQGKGTIIKLADNANTPGPIVQISLSNVDDWTLRDFLIDGNKANNVADDASRGIVLTTCNDCVIQNVHIINCPSAGIRVTTNSHRNRFDNCVVDGAVDHGLIILDTCNDNVVATCWVGNTDEDALIGLRFGVNRNLVVGCTLYNPPSTAPCIQIDSGTALCRNNRIIGCAFDGNDTTPDSRTCTGISVVGANGVPGTIAEGNTIENCRWGVSLVTTGPGTITGNTIVNCDEGIAIATEGPWIIDSNIIDTIEGTSGDGVGIDVDVDNNVITNNYIVDCTSQSVDLDSDNNIVSGNRITGGTLRGINVRAGADNNTITGNDLTGNSTSMVDAGAGNITRNNIAFVTENSGTGSIASGTTADVIAHGLSVTPTVDDIMITLAENPTNTPGAIWVDTIGAANFTVNCENDPGASNLDFGWRVAVL